ncbi:MAG: hypothetical protein O7G86_01610, partial [Gammaproteobacteria bacterium]|nr:hypothetical protein [Gammaproteobacteria bacterium]
DQHIDSAPFPLRGIRERPTSVILGHICPHDHGFDIKRFARLLRGEGAIFVVGIVDDNVTTFSASWRAQAAPTPEDEPVTIATPPSRSMVSSPEQIIP